MTGGPLANERTGSQKSHTAGWHSRWLGVCSLESGRLGSHPNPAISWLCDTEEVAAFFCALEREI